LGGGCHRKKKEKNFGLGSSNLTYQCILDYVVKY
jgi:hypothetical protein